MARVRTDGSAEVEYRAFHADGRERLAAHAAPTASTTDRGRPRGVNGVTADITQQRAAAVRAGRLGAAVPAAGRGAAGDPLPRRAGRHARRCTSARGSRSCSGYTPRQWLAGGLEWWFRLVHPDDLLARRPRDGGEHRAPDAAVHPLPGAPRRGRLALVRRRGDRRPRRRRRAALPPGRAARRHRRGARHARPGRGRAALPDDGRAAADGGLHRPARRRRSPTSTSRPRSSGCSATRSTQWVGNPRDVPSRAAPRGPRAGAGRAAGVARPGRRVPRRVPAGRAATATTSGSARSRTWSPATTGRPLYTQGYLEDVTERRAAERDLATSERRLRMVTDNMNDVIFLYGMDRKLRYVTPSFEELTGFTRRGAVRAQLPERRPPRRRGRGCCRCGGRVFDGRVLHRRRVPDHQPRRPREVVLERRLAGATTPAASRSASRSATPTSAARKRAELRLRASEERSRLDHRDHRGRLPRARRRGPGDGVEPGRRARCSASSATR